MKLEFGSVRDPVVRILAFALPLTAFVLASWLIGGLTGFLAGIVAGLVIYALYGLDITYELALYGGFVGGVIFVIGISAIALYRRFRRRVRSN